MLDRFYIRRLIEALWLGSLLLILAASFLSNGTKIVELATAGWWNFGHIPAYALFAGLTLIVVSQRIKLTFGLLAALAVGLGLFGLTIEVLQPHFGRTASATDFAYDMLGILLAMGAFFFMGRGGQVWRFLAKPGK